MEKVVTGEVKWDEVLATILALMRDDPYMGTKLSSPKKIYKNFGELLTKTRMKLQQNQPNIKSFSS
ncbi:MAG: hypothetical protein Q4B28_07800 [bacterium]|nr:hypothetical protein [bacterium]